MEVLIAVHPQVCMSSYGDQYIVIIVLVDTNWSAWNFDQNPWYEIHPGYMCYFGGIHAVAESIRDVSCLFSEA